MTRWKFASLLDVFRRNMVVDAEILDLVSKPLLPPTHLPTSARVSSFLARRLSQEHGGRCRDPRLGKSILPPTHQPTSASVPPSTYPSKRKDALFTHSLTYPPTHPPNHLPTASSRQRRTRKRLLVCGGPDRPHGQRRRTGPTPTHCLEPAMILKRGGRNGVNECVACLWMCVG